MVTQIAFPEESSLQSEDGQAKRHQLERGLILFAAAVRQATSGEVLSRMLGHKVTDSQADALRFLALNENVSMSEIAVGLGHTISGATKAVNRLEKHGWVERIQSGDDHRTVYVRLTEKGKEIADQLLAQTQERLRRILTKVRPETADLLGRVIEEFLYDYIDDKAIVQKLCVACGFEGGIHCCESEMNCVVAKTAKSMDKDEEHEAE